ncbi:MAG TPA: hypothetical protein VIY26_16830 [Acidimicrobiales bacterium]
MAGATDPRFDRLERTVAQLMNQVAEADLALAEGLTELRALRQQVEECLDFVRLDHDIVRDLLEELKPSLGREGR